MSKLLFFILALYTNLLPAQSPAAVTESQPVNVNGLSMGFTIKSEEEKEVGNKGNFSRFAVKFYVTNTTQESKIMLYKDGFNLLNDVSDKLAQFNCLNATGARLTSKSAILQAAPCNILAMVEDKDGAGKTVKNKRYVQIGYWIKAGQTISTSAIVIVPLNERPNMEVIYLANSLQPLATAGYSSGGSGSSNGGYNNAPANNTGQQNPFPAGFVKLRNVSSNHYLNTEGGQLGCTVINNDWWSAQWQIIPVNVNGINYYSLQNRWKTSFLSLDNGSLLSPGNQNTNALWIIESMDGGNSWFIKNGSKNAAITDQRGTVMAIPLDAKQANTKWVIEP